MSMTENSGDELTRRHRAAAGAVTAMLALTAVLVALSFVGVRPNVPTLRNPVLYGVLWIVILFFGLGAIAYRRTKFNALRLQDVAAVRGTGALLATLQQTTVLVALLGGGIAVMGYVISLISDEPLDALKAGVVAIAVLLYAFPRRAAWAAVERATNNPDGLTADDPTAKGTNA